MQSSRVLVRALAPQRGVAMASRFITTSATKVCLLLHMGLS
jgi:hypothetical protein